MKLLKHLGFLRLARHFINDFKSVTGKVNIHLICSIVFDMTDGLDVKLVLTDSLYGGDTGNPGNDYSGLNSLMTRLRNRHWNGMGPLTSSTDTVGGKEYADTRQEPDMAGVQDSTAIAGASNQTDARSIRQSANSDGGDMDIPVYFFFELGTTNLTEPSQSINLDALAHVIIRYGLHVTGTEEINDRLGRARAEYIARELVRRGVAPDRIEKADIGGISNYNPLEGNRHTQVRLNISR